MDERLKNESLPGHQWSKELMDQMIRESEFRKLIPVQPVELKWWEPSWYALLRCARRVKGACLVLVGRADWE